MQEQMQQDYQEVEATPEEQAAHDQYAREALKPVAANGNVWQGMLKLIRSSKNMLPHTLAQITLRLITGAEKKLGPVPSEDILEGIAETIIEQILRSAAEVGVIGRNDVSEEVAVEALVRFAKQFVEQNPDRADEEDRQMLSEVQSGNQAMPGEQPQQQPQPAQPGGLLGGVA